MNSTTTRNFIVGIQRLLRETNIKNNIAGGGLFIFKGSSLPEVLMDNFFLLYVLFI